MHLMMYINNMLRLIHTMNISSFIKLYLPCIRGFFKEGDSTGLEAIHCFVNWFMLISLPVQSEASLEKASKFLNAFNQYKKAFDDVCSTRIPKIHSLQHYREYIQNFRTPDNFDTKYTEHQHIIDAKQPYLRTNKQYHVTQMIHH